MHKTIHELIAAAGDDAPALTAPGRGRFCTRASPAGGADG